MVIANSTHDQKVVGSNLVSSKILDGNGVKAMPGSIHAPNSGSFDYKKNTGSQMGTTKKKDWAQISSDNCTRFVELEGFFLDKLPRL